jgi:sulfoxide reductase catalytic subunit YedY
MRFAAGALAGFYVFSGPLLKRVRWAWAEGKRIILSRDVGRSELIDKDPAVLDTRNLEPMPLESFGTMGVTDHEVDLETWRLRVTGQVKHPLSLTYAELMELPPLEREVLLICPGFFANHGQWRGFSIAEILRRAGAETDVTRVSVSGPEGPYPKTFTCSMDEVSSGRVFLAHNVNGQPLPQRHGYPLRLVAEGYYGTHWVKYVYKIEAGEK